MEYRVTAMREGGLKARWTHQRGRPILVVQDPDAEHPHQREKWWVVTAAMFRDMHRDGVRAAFRNHTLLGDIFSVSA